MGRGDKGSGFRTGPVLVEAVLPQLPLALGLVLVNHLGHRRRRQRHLLHLVAGLVVLSRVPLALAGRHHGDLVGAGAAVLALQLDALCPRLVVDAAPVLAAPPAPELLPAAAPDPVRQHGCRQALTGTHQLLDGLDAGALAVRDVLGGAQLPTAHLVLLQT